MAPNRVRWTPRSEEDRDIVGEALEKILSSPQFRHSKRYPGFLRYVVEQALNGDGEQIKERTVGVEVFGRTPDYDTNADTIVRYTAGEVRKRLALYYSTEPESRIQISLSARSYHPEFYKLEAAEQEPTAEPAASSDGASLQRSVDAAGKTSSIYTPWTVRRNIAAFIAFTCLGMAVALAGQWAWGKRSNAAMDRFWSPVLRGDQPVLIAPGGVVLTPSTSSGTAIANNANQDPYLSFENALAMGRMQAVLGSRRQEYEILPAASVSLEQLRENSVILVGAYNNAWTQRLLMPLRFHFAAHPNEAIVDAWRPQKYWIRDTSKPSTESPDYGLIARFRDPLTDSVVVVVAGLQRYGTDAASEFASSPRFLNQLNRQIGSDWENKSVEVVVRVDVANGRAGEPIAEAVHVW